MYSIQAIKRSAKVFHLGWRGMSVNSGVRSAWARIGTRYTSRLHANLNAAEVVVRPWWDEAIFIHAAIDPTAEAAGTVHGSAPATPEQQQLFARLFAIQLDEPKAQGEIFTTRIQSLNAPDANKDATNQREPIARVTLYVPQGASIDIGCTGAVIVEGKVEAALSVRAHGDVRVDRSMGPSARLFSHSGCIHARSLEAQSVSVIAHHDVVLHRVFARSFAAHTHAGAMTVHSLYSDHAALTATATHTVDQNKQSTHGSNGIIVHTAHAQAFHASVSGPHAPITCSALVARHAVLSSVHGPIACALHPESASASASASASQPQRTTGSVMPSASVPGHMHPNTQALHASSVSGSITVTVPPQHSAQTDVVGSSIHLAPELKAASKWDSLPAVLEFDPVDELPQDNSVTFPRCEHVGSINNGGTSKIQVHTAGPVRIETADWESSLKQKMMLARKATRSKMTDL
eukprot:TRINITY_DN2353_c0_g1_i2.p1 TRINITY_DN2353_c0_g1~~TRINITY_DN2353_c0_g1_i2.p1  ORF type:complete len:462 (-),score=90.65 TRINITY_DN2353_c0_g1_i2:31-1416(-)